MYGAIFQVTGQVMEKRELTSAKNTTWRGYLLKVATLGATFELNVTKEQFDSVNEGAEIVAKGRIEDNKGITRLATTELALVKTKAAA